KRGDALHSANLAVGSAVASGAWSVASVLTHLPGYATIAGVGLTSGLVLWQAIKAKVEHARQARQRERNPGG
ncbi:MAG: hypothetical protein J2P15_21070, partial [Micromonosporaceae bacterium]|nr:hypothetical protein [Micromonosporaceae bacterium]